MAFASENLTKLKTTVKTSFCITITMFKHVKSAFMFMIMYGNMKNERLFLPG